MSHVRTSRIAAIALALALPLTACDDATDAEFGTVSIQLTDAAGEQVVEAWVTITDIYFQAQPGENDPEDSRVYVLRDGAETEELLSLANSVADLVVGEEVPTGSYGQLRIVMSGGCVVTDSGDVYASSPSYGHCGPADGGLTMPSFDETGAKVLLNGLQVTGGQQVLLLDFDVSQSFGRQAGMANTWVMHPVIHGAEIELTAGAGATLVAGDVSLPQGFALGQFSATLLPTVGDSARVDFTDTDGNGTFEASFELLLPGNGPFDMRLNPPAGLSVSVDPASPVTVNPASGETASVEWTLQSASTD